MRRWKDKAWQERFCVLTINYNTPDLLETMLASVREFWPSLLVVVVDGSDKPEYVEPVKKLCGEDPNVTLYTIGYNIHHGPGLNYAMRKIGHEYVFLMDTDDMIIREDIFARMFELMDDEVYAVGSMKLADDDCKFRKDGSRIPYIFTNGVLLNVAQYKRYAPAKIHDGALFPAMKQMYKKGESSLRLRHFPGLDDFYIKRGPGVTRIRFANQSGCDSDWFIKKKDLIDKDWGRWSKKRIFYGRPFGATSKYGVDLLEARKDNPPRARRSLVISEYDIKTNEPIRDIVFDDFDPKAVGDFLGEILSASLCEIRRMDKVHIGE